MYLDILALDNYGNFNIKLAKLTDLPTACYWSELINVLKQVIKKKKYTENGFFTLDRKYITDRTTLPEIDQLNCDAILAELGVLTWDSSDRNNISISLESMTSLLVDEDMKKLKEIKKKAKVSKAAQAQAKHDLVIQGMKSSIVEPDIEIRDRLCSWIDSVYASGWWLTQKKISIFMDTIKKYSSDKDVQLEILDRAVVSGWSDPAKVIADYQKSKTLLQSAPINKVSVAADQKGVGF